MVDVYILINNSFCQLKIMNKKAIVVIPDDLQIYLFWFVLNIGDL